MTLKQKQALLAYLGYYDGPLDGLWGEKSQRATIDFQRPQGDNPVGQIGGDVIFQSGAVFQMRGILVILIQRIRQLHYILPHPDFHHSRFR